ncbi:MAG: Sjogren's syndrome/scleroderma autoantigen 1 family protein [Candidatus Hermodarchaeota archaeon]
MADLLRSGYTMLNLSCPICKNPIFQDKNGRKFCPICNREVIITKNNLNSEQPTNNIDKINGKNGLRISGKSSILFSLRKITIEKIKDINDRLKSEHQIEMIKKFSDILLKLLEILILIKKITYEDK